MNHPLNHQVLPAHSSPASEAEALVVSCMDFRLIGAVADYMEKRGLVGRYDYVTLAGGALGAMGKDKPAWAESFWQHLALARKLHNINRLILIDHRDCGACKMFIGPDCADDPEAEKNSHRMIMKRLASEVKVREPGLEIELLLMNLDGSVMSIS